MSCLRAALNLGYRDGLVTSDFAWRGKLVPIKNADRRREGYLDKDQRRKFIDKAPPDLALFLRGLSLLPLRPGALAALTVADFDRRLGVLKVGQDKAGRDRKIKLPTTTAELFERGSLRVGRARAGEACFELPPGSMDHGQRIAGYYGWFFPNLMLNTGGGGRLRNPVP